MEERKLTMTFKNVLGNNFTLTIDDPREDLEEDDVVNVMNLIKEKNIFQPKETILLKKKSKIVTTLKYC